MSSADVMRRDRPLPFDSPTSSVAAGLALVAAPRPVVIANPNGSETSLAQRRRESGQGPGQEDLDLERTVCRRTHGAAQVVFMHGQVVKVQPAGPLIMTAMSSSKESHSSVSSPTLWSRRSSTRSRSHSPPLENAVPDTSG